MADIRVHFKLDTTAVEIGLVTSSVWQTKTRGGTRPHFVNKTSRNTRGPLRSNLHCTIVSSTQSKPRSVVFTCANFCTQLGRNPGRNVAGKCVISCQKCKYLNWFMFIFISHVCINECMDGSMSPAQVFQYIGVLLFLTSDPEVTCYILI